MGIHSFEKVPPGFSTQAGFKNTEALAFAADWVSGAQTFQLRTSGSTGTPKIITVTREQMEASARATLTFLGLGKLDKALIGLDTGFIGGKMMIVRVLLSGMKAHLQTPEADPLLAHPTDHDFTFTALVPFQLQHILQRKNGVAQLQRFKAILLGGASISPELENQCREHHLPIWQTYGMTETVSHIALRHLGKGEVFYKTLPEVRIGTDDRSCLWVSGPMTNHELIQTNDLVKLMDTNRFSWLGRADFIINSGGLKLNPEELERQIQSLGLIQSPFLLVGIPDEQLGEKVVMLLEGSDVPSLDVQRNIKERLGSKQAPKSYTCVPALPYSSNNKINRKACREIVMKS